MPAEMSPQLERAVERIEQARFIDPAADRVARAVRSLLAERVELRNILSGTPLGHPLHPPLTDVTIGTLAAASLLDLVSARRGASVLTVVGVVAAVPTALAGINDWLDTDPEERRIGIAHADLNSVALLLYLSALRHRRRGRGLRATVRSLLGFAALAASGYLGGHLSFRRGVGVNRNAFVTLPEGWRRAVALADLPERELTRVDVEEVGIVLYRVGEEVYALADRCGHLGGPLSDGHAHEDGAPQVSCPWHHSTFRLGNGAVVRGPAAGPQPVFETRVVNGVVQVRAT